MRGEGFGRAGVVACSSRRIVCKRKREMNVGGAARLQGRLR